LSALRLEEECECVGADVAGNQNERKRNERLPRRGDEKEEVCGLQSVHSESKRLWCPSGNDYHCKVSRFRFLVNDWDNSLLILGCRGPGHHVSSV